MSFVQDCLEGDALLEEIDDYVDRWHDGDSDSSLADFLGFTADEYKLWVEKPQALKFIIYSREYGEPLGNVVRVFADKQVAARAKGDEAQTILQWLISKGRL